MMNAHPPPPVTDFPAALEYDTPATISAVTRLAQYALLELQLFLGPRRVSRPAAPVARAGKTS